MPTETCQSKQNIVQEIMLDLPELTRHSVSEILMPPSSFMVVRMEQLPLQPGPLQRHDSPKTLH